MDAYARIVEQEFDLLYMIEDYARSGALQEDKEFLEMNFVRIGNHIINLSQVTQFIINEYSERITVCFADGKYVEFSLALDVQDYRQLEEWLNVIPTLETLGNSEC